MNKIRLILADDHLLFRRGLTTFLRTLPMIEVVGDAANGWEAVRAVEELQPDLVLMELKLAECDGLTATRLIKEKHPRVQVVLLTLLEDQENFFTALSYGADGYLLKTVAPPQLQQMLENYSKGMGRLFSPGFTEMMVKRLQSLPRAVPSILTAEMKLSARQLEVMQLLGQGLSNEEIAQALCISEHTVKNHVRGLMDKLKADNRVQAVTFALKEGLIDNLHPHYHPKGLSPGRIKRNKNDP